MRILYFVIFIVLVNVNGRRVSDDERRRRANLIQQHLKKFKEQEGHLRLVGGKDKYEGNVEIFHNGKWGAVCDDEWGPEEAYVVCGQLGFGTSLRSTQSSEYGLATRKYWMDNLYCDGSESKLASCRFDGWGESDCVPEEAAGVVCGDVDKSKKKNSTVDLDEVGVQNTEQANARARFAKKVALGDAGLEVRLAGGRSREEGRVEILHRGRWGPVCGDGWSLREAMVACRTLGLGYASDAYQTTFFGGNSSEIVISGVRCNSTETHLSECLRDGYDDGDNDTTPNEVFCPGTRSNLAGVACAREMADLVFDHFELMRTAHLEDRSLMLLQCAMEENCLASQAYALRRDNENWPGETRRLLRFTVAALNAGTADFRPAVPKHMWEWHMCHMHYHSMEVFATFDVIDQAGRRVAEGHKASFCLEDNTCMPGVEPKYACDNYGDQGVSVNCSDIYKHTIDCQWVDISELVPGDYVMRVAVNPEMKVPEMSYENNAATCKLLYTEMFATVYDCRLHMP